MAQRYLTLAVEVAVTKPTPVVLKNAEVMVQMQDMAETVSTACKNDAALFRNGYKNAEKWMSSASKGDHQGHWHPSATG